MTNKIETAAMALQATDLWAIKQSLHMGFVMEYYGHDPEVAEAGKLHYLSPFRDDTNPSFDVFMHQIANRPEPEERYADFADANLKQGDVFDLIGKFEPTLSRPEINDKARELLAKQLQEQWDGPTTSTAESRTLDLSNIQMLTDLAVPVYASTTTWWNTISSRPALMDAKLPVSRVFIRQETDTLVYLLKDENGDVKGVRYRWDDGSKTTMPGSKNILMRMEPPSDKPVFLTEGETDTWAAWAHLGSTYEVLGVPGVGNHPEKTCGDVLDGRDVTIAFDGDTAGKAGAANWRAFLESRGCTVSSVILPEGRDVSSLQPEEVRRLPDRVRVLPPNTSRIIRQNGVFAWDRQNRDGDVDAVTNWSYVPTSILIGEDGERSYEGILYPLNRSVVLPASALTSINNIQKWGLKYQAFWLGNANQVQHLATLLAYESAMLPEGRLTTQVGLYEGTFVWPENYIGDKAVYYAAPETHIPMGRDRIFVSEDPCDPIEVFEDMMATQDPAVITPMLAWLAAAPLRSRFREFPILSVTGVSGSGKTALTEELIKVFSGSNITTNLTSTTPHAVAAFIASSNGFPVWFDEYRPGARADAKNALDQTLRDAYTGQESSRGGQNRSNLSEVTSMATTAPIVVTGEDDFTETSHTDRMILVRLVQSEQGDLRSLTQSDTRGFSGAYLRYLTRQGPIVVEGPPVYETFNPQRVPGLRPRQGMNAAILKIGWGLLEGFLQDRNPLFDMPHLVLDGVIQAGEEAGKTDPVMDLVRYCWENDGSLTGPPAVWSDEEYLYIHTGNLVGQAKNAPGIVLPATSTRGLNKLLRETRGAETLHARVPTTFGGKGNSARVCAIPLRDVEWVDADEMTIPAIDPEI